MRPKFPQPSRKMIMNQPQRFDTPKSKELSLEEMTKLYSHPAVFSNKFYVTLQADGMVRIVFADVDPGEKIMVPRCSIVMPALSYIMFANLISANVDNARNLMANVVRAYQPRQMPAVINEPTVEDIPQTPDTPPQ